MKSEPDVFGIDDIAKRKTEGWNGVRNYQARNFMKSMKLGDRVLFYHSNADPSGVAGIAEVSRESYPDPTQFDRKSEYFEKRATKDFPVWFQVDLTFVSKFPRFVPLDELRGMPELQEMDLFKRSRLSVQPVTPAQWRAIVARAK
ncbi:MAG: EVE domain-containing protein [Elusimicrobia bacterium]|nr:EVE domain-containing protein [Elusimicrobiota bacterium]